MFSDGRPRLIQIKGINIDAEATRHMLYTTNTDVPGIVGVLGTTLGDKGVSIANFNLGRSKAGQNAIALLSIDSPANPSVCKAVSETGRFNQVRPLEFDVGNEA